MLNSISIMGRLTREPELKHTQGGVAVCTITLACERDFVGQDGRREADFIDVVCWRGTAELVARWFRKGLLVAVEGRLQSRKWSDQYGQNRTGWEVVADSVYFAERAERDGPSQPPAAAALPNGASQGAALRGGHREPREDLRPVDPSRADIQADYTGDLYQLPQDDFAGLDDDEDVPF
jgi:single-strand DNA-binding protein